MALHVSLCCCVFESLINYYLNSYIFLAGKFGICVPFYNGIFNGKSARMQLFGTTQSLGDDLQELDFGQDRKKPQKYIAFRGGFVSLWKGVDF